MIPTNMRRSAARSQANDGMSIPITAKRTKPPTEVLADLDLAIETSQLFGYDINPKKWLDGEGTSSRADRIRHK